MPPHRIFCHFTACAATSFLLLLHRLAAILPILLPLLRLFCSFTDFYATSPHFVPLHRLSCGSILSFQFTNDYRGVGAVILQTLNNAADLLAFVPSVKIFFKHT
jgi:hypothetical protein